MKKSQSDELDDMLFELSYKPDPEIISTVQGPISNKVFLRKLTIGLAILFAAPIVALIIVALMGH